MCVNCATPYGKIVSYVRVQRCWEEIKDGEFNMNEHLVFGFNNM